MLEVSGVRTFAAFVKGAKCVEIETADGDSIRFIPTKNEGPKDGFTPLQDMATTESGSDTQLAEAAVSALALS